MSDPKYLPIEGSCAFYCRPGLNECYVDEELAIPQEGYFYGGWISSFITGGEKGIKGAKGTEWWWKFCSKKIEILVLFFCFEIKNNFFYEQIIIWKWSLSNKNMKKNCDRIFHFFNSFHFFFLFFKFWINKKKMTFPCDSNPFITLFDNIKIYDPTLLIPCILAAIIGFYSGYRIYNSNKISKWNYSISFFFFGTVITYKK